MTQRSLPRKANHKVRSYENAYNKGGSIRHVYTKEGTWVIKKRSAERISGSFSTQRKALTIAKRMAKREGSSVVLHSREGAIKNIITPR